MKTSFISATTIIDDWLDLVPDEERVDEPFMRKMANKAVSKFITSDQYEEKIALMTVKGYKIELPQDFRYVVQAAYNIDSSRCSREEVVQWTQSAFDGSGCSVTIDLNCPKCHETTCSCGSSVISVDVNRVYETSHPEIYTSYMDHFYRSGGTTGRGTHSYYHPQFCLMRHKSGSFHNLAYHIGECLNLNVDSEIEYSIEHPFMIVNFEAGQVLISYMGRRTDENGYLFMPDNEYALDAVVKFIEERLAYKRWRASKSQTDGVFYQTALALMTAAFRTARGKLMQPNQDKFKVFVDNYWRKLIPYHHYEQNMRRFQRDKAIPTPNWLV